MNLGQVLDELCDATSIVEPGDRAKALRTINLAYFDLCGLASFVQLRKSITFTTGSYLPSDLIGIDGIYDGDGNIYHGRDRSQIGQMLGRDQVRRWYYDDIIRQPSEQRKGINIEHGATSFDVTPALSSNYVGEYMTLGKELGFYKITAANTITPRYMGPKLIAASSSFQIRPEGTRQLRLVDESGDADGTAVTVDYWAYPPALYDEAQLILLPTTRALYLRALIRSFGIDLMNQFAADRFRAEYQEAVAELRDRNPKYSIPFVPADRRGGQAGWGSKG